jgi:hypothetical protein
MLAKLQSGQSIKQVQDWAGTSWKASSDNGRVTPAMN